MPYRRITFSILLSLGTLVIGCKNSSKFIHYEYHGITVTRVNDYPKDYFYYGNFDKSSELPDNYILSKFSGFDGMMSAFLIFKKNRTVEIIPVADDFSKIGDKSSIKLNNEMENVDFINWRDSTENSLDSIIELSDVIKLEINRNNAGHSKVKAKYNRSLLQD